MPYLIKRRFQILGLQLNLCMVKATGYQDDQQTCSFPGLSHLFLSRLTLLFLSCLSFLRKCILKNHSQYYLKGKKQNPLIKCNLTCRYLKITKRLSQTNPNCYHMYLHSVHRHSCQIIGILFVPSQP